MSQKIHEKPILTLDDLPKSGLIFWSDFLSNTQERRLVPFSNSTWRRMIRNGLAPPTVKWFGRLAAHSEHVRAVVLGQDWRSVPLAGDMDERGAA
jgi:hypothetical protein